MVLDPVVKYAVPLTDETVGSPRLPIMEDSTPMIEEKIPAGPLSVSLLDLASCQLHSSWCRGGVYEPYTIDLAVHEACE